MFYDEGQVVQMLADAPRRYDDGEPYPEHLKTMDQLMIYRGVSRAFVRQHMRVGAQRYRRWGKNWEDLYDVNAFGRVFWPQ